jgi:hypothetical protein
MRWHARVHRGGVSSSGASDEVVVLVREPVAAVGASVRGEAVHDGRLQLVFAFAPGGRGEPRDGDHRAAERLGVVVGEEVTRESLQTLRDDVTDLRRRLDDSGRSARDLPHREKYLLLVIDFLRGYLDLHDRLVDDVEREFAAARENASS